MDPIILGLIFVVALNALIFPIAYKLQTDKLTDITYALSFSALVGFGVAMGGGFESISKIILALLVILWAVRLGYFLLRRVTQLGKDDRFDQIRNNPKRFFRFFMLQGVSSWLISLPFLFRLLDQPGTHQGFSDTEMIEWLGWLLAFAGFIIEALADHQKSVFKSQAGNRGKLYTGKLYSIVQYPNYLGEIAFWLGIFIASIPALAGLKWLAVVSPIIIIVLLLFVSGIPTVERERRKKYGNDEVYRHYDQSTPKIFPGIY